MPLRSNGDVVAGRLRDGLPAAPQDEEQIDILMESSRVRMERIVSTGQATPEGHWYDPVGDEFVLLVAGAARLRIEGEAADRALESGDWIVLPAHCRHRVTWTQEMPPTIWLAIHYETAEA